MFLQIRKKTFPFTFSLTPFLAHLRFFCQLAAQLLASARCGSADRIGLV
jgi:hypothetical protein